MKSCQSRYVYLKFANNFTQFSSTAFFLFQSYAVISIHVIADDFPTGSHAFIDLDFINDLIIYSNYKVYSLLSSDHYIILFWKEYTFLLDVER